MKCPNSEVFLNSEKSMNAFLGINVRYLFIMASLALGLLLVLLVLGIWLMNACSFSLDCVFYF